MNWMSGTLFVSGGDASSYQYLSGLPRRGAIFGLSSQVSHRMCSFSASSISNVTFSYYSQCTFWIHIFFTWNSDGSCFEGFLIIGKHCMVYVFLEKWSCNRGCICRCGKPVKRLKDVTHNLVDWLLVCHKPLKIEAQNCVLFIYLFAGCLENKASFMPKKWYYLIKF